MAENPNDPVDPTPAEPTSPPPPQDVPPPVGPDVTAEAPPTKDETNLAMLCHLLAIFTGVIAPLIIWLIKKDESRFVDQQGKEVVNFELTLLIGVVAGVLTACIFVGVVILLAVQALNIVFGILSTIAVSKGQSYRYPVCIRFIK